MGAFAHYKHHLTETWQVSKTCQVWPDTGSIRNSASRPHKRGPPSNQRNALLFSQAQDGAEYLVAQP